MTIVRGFSAGDDIGVSGWQSDRLSSSRGVVFAGRFLLCLSCKTWNKGAESFADQRTFEPAFPGKNLQERQRYLIQWSEAEALQYLRGL